MGSLGEDRHANGQGRAVRSKGVEHVDLLFGEKQGSGSNGTSRTRERAPRRVIPFSLHPDYDRRPRNHTGSADLPLAVATGKRSRAMRVAQLPPVGTSTPP